MKRGCLPAANSYLQPVSCLARVETPKRDWTPFQLGVIATVIVAVLAVIGFAIYASLPPTATRAQKAAGALVSAKLGWKLVSTETAYHKITGKFTDADADLQVTLNHPAVSFDNDGIGFQTAGGGRGYIANYSYDVPVARGHRHGNADYDCKVVKPVSGSARVSCTYVAMYVG